MRVWVAPLPLLLVLVALGSVEGQKPIPGPAQTKPVALVGGTVHPVSRPPIPNGTVVFRDGRITAVGRGVAVPDNAEVIDVTGRHVYPSLIACGTQLGLVEIGAVRSTRDQSEVGQLNPNVRAEVAVNPDSELIPVARSNGIGLVVTRPSGGLVSGSSALIRLDGWTWEDLTVEAPLGIHINWPRMRVAVSGDPAAARRARERRDEQIRSLDELFARARAYSRLEDRGPAVDLRLEALLPVLTREKPVFLHANSQRQIRNAVEWARGQRLRAVIVGGRDAPGLASFLAENDVAVIYGPVHTLPRRRDADFDTPFRAPAELKAAGVRFAIASFETSNVRNLPYHAATAAAYGLDPEEALRAVTLSPAEIMGVAEEVGSLDVGKAATLIVTTGDPLEIVSRVERMWIDGRAIDLNNRQTQLYEKYSERLRRKRPRSF